MMRVVMNNHLRQKGDCIQQAMKQALRKAAKRVVEYARQRVPVDTGRLRDSIQAQGNKVTVGQPYGIFVEYGTIKTPAQPFFHAAVAQARSELRQDLAQIVRDCKEGRTPNIGEDAGDAGEIGESVEGAIGEGIRGFADAVGELAAEGGEIAEVLPLLL